MSPGPIGVSHLGAPHRDQVEGHTDESRLPPRLFFFAPRLFLMLPGYFLGGAPRLPGAPSWESKPLICCIKAVDPSCHLPGRRWKGSKSFGGCPHCLVPASHSAVGDTCHEGFGARPTGFGAQDSGHRQAFPTSPSGQPAVENGLPSPGSPCCGPRCRACSGRLLVSAWPDDAADR
jgi:hypothetical protein